MTHTSIASAFVLALTLAIGCGGSQPEATEPPAPPPAEPVAATPPPPAETAAPTGPAVEAPKEPAKPGWKDMSFDQRKEHMKTVVLPKLASEFQGFDGKKYKDFTCASCHGKDGEKAGFKMPNPKLPKIDPKDGFKKHMQGKTADVTKFMMEKVTPSMVGSLGVAAYDPATQQGFGCGGCHTIVQAK